MQKIFKYAIPVENNFEIELPAKAQILTVQSQGDEVNIWALVNPEAKEMRARRFKLFGTGHAIAEDPEEMNYIGTFQLEDGAFVGHLFEILGQ